MKEIARPQNSNKILSFIIYKIGAIDSGFFIDKNKRILYNMNTRWKSFRYFFITKTRR